MASEDLTDKIRDELAEMTGMVIGPYRVNVKYRDEPETGKGITHYLMNLDQCSIFENDDFRQITITRPSAAREVA